VSDKDENQNFETELQETIESIDFLDDEAGAKLGAAVSSALQAGQKTAAKDAILEAQRTIDAETHRHRFLSENPDFEELQSKGEFQALKEKNPLHDDFSAFYAHKAARLERELAELKDKVGADPAPRFSRPKPKSQQERIASALAAARRAARR
jgi:hypothetical protein